MNSEPRLRFGFPGWRSRSLFWCFAGIFSLSLCQTFAHRPYERAAGTFQRADGTSIAIVRHYVDGILMGDPVSIRFRLPDGLKLPGRPTAPMRFTAGRRGLRSISSSYDSSPGALIYSTVTR